MGGRCGTVWSVCLCSEACAGRCGARDGAVVGRAASARRIFHDMRASRCRIGAAQRGPRRGRLRWSGVESCLLRGCVERISIKWSKTDFSILYIRPDRTPAPAADPPDCVGGVRRWRPRFPLTGSGCVCSAGFFERERRAGSLAPATALLNRQYPSLHSKHILTQTNTSSAVAVFTATFHSFFSRPKESAKMCTPTRFAESTLRRP
jgi:hypothetical protein